jgi:hypothetical protein
MLCQPRQPSIDPPLDQFRRYIFGVKRVALEGCLPASAFDCGGVGAANQPDLRDDVVNLFMGRVFPAEIVQDLVSALPRSASPGDIHKFPGDLESGFGAHSLSDVYC